MKIFLLTTLLVTTVSASAFAQMGNIHGDDSRGEPFNSSYRASGVDPATGMTPGGWASYHMRAGGRASHARAYVKKKKPARVSSQKVDVIPPRY